MHPKFTQSNVTPKFLPVSIINPENCNIHFPDDFSMFCQIAQSPSKSSSSNVSPELKQRPRSKSMLYENTHNLLLPEVSITAYKRSPSPCRKSLGNLPVVKTMLRVSGSSGSSDRSSRRPSLCPMKDSDDGDDSCRPSPSACHFMDDICHVRSFKTTDKGLVNEGDELISRSTGNIGYGCGNDNECWLNSLDCDKSQLKIQILGASGVGKTTLASQFMTSEQICCRMWTVNEESEKLFSLRIDGREFHVLLHDTCETRKSSNNEYCVELLDKMDAYVILFAVDDMTSFDYSKQMLSDIIKKVDVTSVVYLVGNKADLERSREVKSKVCKNLSRVHRCKFAEISTALNHKVDDLLFNIVVDIMKANPKLNGSKKTIYRRRESQLVTTGRTLGKILKRTFGTKSCEHIS